MQMTTQIQIELYGDAKLYLVSAKQGDRKTRFIEAELMIYGTPFEIPSDAVVYANIKKPDKKFCYNECEVKNNHVLIELTNQALAAAGTAYCDIEIHRDSDSEILSSASFTIEIEESMRNESAIISSNEMTALDNKVQYYIDDLLNTKTQILNTEEAFKVAEAARELAAAAAVQQTNTAAQFAADAAADAIEAAEFARLSGLKNAQAIEQHAQNTDLHVTASDKAKLEGVAKSYVLLWNDSPNVSSREENEPVLQELCGLENGKYHVVLRRGGVEYPLLRREYTAAKGYTYYFGGELSEDYTAGEYVIGYKPANSLEQAEYTETGNSTVNGLELAENDFRPPTTDLVKVCMDEHTEDTDIHVTAAEKAKWNAGTGGGEAVTYTLSKTGSTIKLTGSDGTSSSVTDSNTTYGNAIATASGLMSGADKAKLDGVAAGANNYVHPNHTAKTSGLYKVTVDGMGHVSNAAAVTKGDITALGIPGQDTTYSLATASANGLMSKEDKAKLDSHTEDTDIHITAAERAKWNAGTGGGTAYEEATTTQSGLMSASDKAKLDGMAKSYVLLWSDNTMVDYREENEPVLKELCGLENGKYHVVLRRGNTEYPLLRREYTAAKGYTYYFGGELSEDYTAGEYVIGYKPANKLEQAEYNMTGRSTVNGFALEETDFRPPTTDLVKLCMDEHTEDTDIHVTAAEKAKWNAGTGGATYEEATTTASGLMSKKDKAKLDGITTNIQSGTGGSSLQGTLNCTASGLGAVALGIASAARGRYSFAAGGTVNAIGDGSSAMGHYVDASGVGQAVVGKYNKEYDGPAGANATAGTQFIVGVGTSESARANAFRVTTDGYCRGQNAFSGSGADYAEYFEWADGNPDGEDRRGYFVTLEGRKIRKATGADEYILGVISTTPAMIGNTYSDLWQGMYVTDIFGERLTETVEVEAGTDPDTGEVIPAHTETRFMINPEYDPTQPYAGRHERPEWAAVGIVGQLVVMDDGTCEVNGYCRITDSGTGTKSDEKTAYRVMERLDATHIRIFLR